MDCFPMNESTQKIFQNKHDKDQAQECMRLMAKIIEENHFTIYQAAMALDALLTAILKKKGSSYGNEN